MQLTECYTLLAIAPARLSPLPPGTTGATISRVEGSLLTLSRAQGQWSYFLQEYRRFLYACPVSQADRPFTKSSSGALTVTSECQGQHMLAPCECIYYGGCCNLQGLSKVLISEHVSLPSLELMVLQHH